MNTEVRQKIVPRTVMIGGKAFATYTNAKRIVKLVNDVGAVVNSDPEVNNYLKVWLLYFLVQSFVVIIFIMPVNLRISIFPLIFRLSSFRTIMYLWLKCSFLVASYRST